MKKTKITNDKKIFLKKLKRKFVVIDKMRNLYKQIGSNSWCEEMNTNRSGKAKKRPQTLHNTVDVRFK